MRLAGEIPRMEQTASQSQFSSVVMSKMGPPENDLEVSLLYSLSFHRPDDHLPAFLAETSGKIEHKLDLFQIIGIGDQKTGASGQGASHTLPRLALRQKSRW